MSKMSNKKIKISCQNIMPKMSKVSKKKLKRQERNMQKMLRIVNNLRLCHLPKAENSLQIQKYKSTTARHIKM